MQNYSFPLKGGGLVLSSSLAGTHFLQLFSLDIALSQEGVQGETSLAEDT